MLNKPVCQISHYSKDLACIHFLFISGPAGTKGDHGPPGPTGDVGQTGEPGISGMKGNWSLIISVVVIKLNIMSKVREER